MQPCQYCHPSLLALLPRPLACTQGSACLPACIPCPYPTCLVPSWSASVPGCQPVFQRRRWTLLSASTKEPNCHSRYRYRSKQEQGEARGWAATDTCSTHPGGITAGSRARGRVALSSCPGIGVPPMRPGVGKPRPEGLPGARLPAYVCCTHVCAHMYSPTSSVGDPMWCSNGVHWPRDAHPCTLLGWSPPGLGVDRKRLSRN